MQVIAMAGLAQCGKTTLAKDIARIAFERGMKPKMMSFAGALKRASAEIGATKEEQPALYRKFCQQVGGMMRDPAYIPGVTGPDYWVNLTTAECRKVAESEGRVLGGSRPPYVGGTFHENVLIFDDVRFMNELETLRKMGAITIYVDRETELPDPSAKFREDVSEKMAYDMKADGDLRQANFNYTVSSTGNMATYLTRVRPFIPVWLGLEVLGIPKFPENQR